MTPSAALVQSSLDLGLKTHVLVRPRIGGFVYTSSELDSIRNEIYSFKVRVDGVVIGALLPDHRVNDEFLFSIRKEFPDLDITFHKAFDDTPDWKASMDVLIESGVNRILSSGCETHVIKGMSTLKAMIDYAQDKIEILPGGLNDHNIDFHKKCSARMDSFFWV